MVWKKEIREIEKPILVKEIIDKKDRVDTQLFKGNLHETDFSLRHEKVKDRVLSLLRMDKYNRKNDFFLCLNYWIRTGQISVNVDFKDWNKITKPESISRARRELISKAKHGDKELQFLLKDEETLETRKTEEENYKDYFSLERAKRLSRLSNEFK